MLRREIRPHSAYVGAGGHLRGFRIGSPGRRWTSLQRDAAAEVGPGRPSDFGSRPPERPAVSPRRVFLLVQFVALGVGIFVVPGLVRGGVNALTSGSSGGEVADEALGHGRALTDLERKARAEEAFLAYYLVESSESVVENPDVKLGRRRDTACARYFADVDLERRMGRACLESDRRTGGGRGAYLISRRGKVTACTQQPAVVGPGCPRRVAHDVRQAVFETCARSVRRKTYGFSGDGHTYAQAIEKCAP